MVNVNGLVVTTSSGTIYHLGKVSDEYLKWLEEEGIPWDPENPIVKKFIGT